MQGTTQRVQRNSSAAPRNYFEATLLGLIEERRLLGSCAPQELAHVRAHVLDGGSWWSPHPRPRSVRRRAEKHCFSNSQRFLLERSRDHPDEAWVYVEGFSLRPEGVCIHHGWCGDGAGLVVDTTWQYPGLAYLGVAFTAGQVARWLLANNARFYRPMLIAAECPSKGTRRKKT
jgi:hypothetical protein